MGMASSRSSALPCGMPSTTSTRTTSASSLDAIQWAAVAPTLPAPTMLTFLRIVSILLVQQRSGVGGASEVSGASKRIAANSANTREARPAPLAPLHVSDNSCCELAGSHLGCVGELTLEIVCDELLLNGLLHRVLDELGCFFPADEIEEHDAGEDDGARVDDVLVGILGRGAVGGFEDGVSIADVGAGSNAEASDLRGGRVGDVVAIEIGGGQDAVVGWANDDLLEDGVGDAVVDEDFRFPGAVAVGLADGVEGGFHFGIDRIAESLGREFEARFDEAAFCSTVRLGFDSRLPRIQLSRSVTVSRRNSWVATS